MVRKRGHAWFKLVLYPNSGSKEGGEVLFKVLHGASKEICFLLL